MLARLERVNNSAKLHPLFNIFHSHFKDMLCTAYHFGAFSHGCFIQHFLQWNLAFSDTTKHVCFRQINIVKNDFTLIIICYGV